MGVRRHPARRADERVKLYRAHVISNNTSQVTSNSIFLRDIGTPHTCGCPGGYTVCEMVLGPGDEASRGEAYPSPGVDPGQAEAEAQECSSSVCGIPPASARTG